MTAYLVQAENTDGDDLDLFVFAEGADIAAEGWVAYYDLEGSVTLDDPQSEKPDGDYLRVITCPSSTNQRSGAVHWNNIEQVFIPVEYW